MTRSTSAIITNAVRPRAKCAITGADTFSAAATLLLAALVLLAALTLMSSLSWSEGAGKPDDLRKTAPAGTASNTPRSHEALGHDNPDLPTCSGKFSAPRKVIAAITPASFELDTGEVVNVTGVLPQPTFTTQGLDDLLRGKAVSLAPPDAPADRWVRIQAHAFIHGDQSGTPGRWLQSQLVAEGLALAYAAPQLQPCQTQLLDREAEARRKKRGVWATDPTLTRSADAREALTGDEGTFRIVSGRVSRVSASRGRVYLNFGRNWRQDFTVLIPADVMRSWPKPAPDFENLRGKTVHVRGWVRNRNGPLIVIESPSMLDAPDLKPASTITRTQTPSHP